jgi:hypothetical protein
MLKNQNLSTAIPAATANDTDLGFSKPEALIHIKEVLGRNHPKRQPEIGKLEPSAVELYLWCYFYMRNRVLYLRKNPYLGLL